MDEKELSDEDLKRLKYERLRMIEAQKKALIQEIARTQAIASGTYPTIKKEHFRTAYEIFQSIPHEKWMVIMRDLHNWNMENKEKEQAEISPIITQPTRFYTSYIKGTLHEKIKKMNMVELELILTMVMERIDELEEEKEKEYTGEKTQDRSDMIEMD